MKFGLFSMNTGPCSYPESAARIARLAEEVGFESLWAGEHVVLPDPQVPPSPLAPEDRILDPIVALTFLAAHTSRIHLGTGIIILPQRNPLVLESWPASMCFRGGASFSAWALATWNLKCARLGFLSQNEGRARTNTWRPCKPSGRSPNLPIMVASSPLRASRRIHIQSRISRWSLADIPRPPIVAPSKLATAGMALP